MCKEPKQTEQGSDLIQYEVNSTDKDLWTASVLEPATFLARPMSSLCVLHQGTKYYVN